MGAIKNPQEYLQVLNTGRLDQMFDGEMKELFLIRKENEMMLNGQAPMAAPTDLHSQHILEHRDILSDPGLRTDPKFIKLVMDHIEEHLNALRNVDPQLLGIIKETPLPQPPQPGQQPPPPQGPPGMPPPGAGGPPPGPPMPPGMPPNPGPPHPHHEPPMPHGMHPPRGHNVMADQGPIKGGSLTQPTNLPGLPKPPGQFSHLPVVASQVIPQ